MWDSGWPNPVTYSTPGTKNRVSFTIPRKTKDDVSRTWEILLKWRGLTAEQVETSIFYIILTICFPLRTSLLLKSQCPQRSAAITSWSSRCQCVSVISNFTSTSHFISGSIYSLRLTFKNDALHRIHCSHRVLSILGHLSISTISKHSLYTCISSMSCGQEPIGSSRNGMGFCCRSTLFSTHTVQVKLNSEEEFAHQIIILAHVKKSQKMWKTGFDSII